MQALWMLAATFMFALMGMFVKLASETGANLPQIVLMRGIPSVVMLLIWARSARLTLRPAAWRPHLWRNMAGLTGMWLGFYALSQLPLATAITLNYTAPLFIAGWMLGWGGAGMDRVRLFAVALGFMGVLAVLRPTLNPDMWLAALAGVGAGAFGAVAQLQIRSLGRSGEAGWRIVLFFSVGICITGVVALALQGWQPLSPSGWAALCGLGMVGLLGQLALTRAFGLGSALLSAALQYTIIIFASVIGFALWGDRPDSIAMTGMALIVGASLLSVWRTAQSPSS
jgi:S-adenosylmethionine uptake transporter